MTRKSPQRVLGFCYTLPETAALTGSGCVVDVWYYFYVSATMWKYSIVKTLKQATHTRLHVPRMQVNIPVYPWQQYQAFYPLFENLGTPSLLPTTAPFPFYWIDFWDLRPLTHCSCNSDSFCNQRSVVISEHWPLTIDHSVSIYPSLQQLHTLSLRRSHSICVGVC